MAIIIEKLKGGYRIFSTMDGYCLLMPDGTHKWFALYSQVEKYCKERGIELD